MISLVLLEKLAFLLLGLTPMKLNETMVLYSVKLNMGMNIEYSGVDI